MCVCVFSDLSEQIKAVTKDSHTRAENTELMLSYQRGHVSLEQYQVNTHIIHHYVSFMMKLTCAFFCLQMLLCSLYKIYEALEEALDSNATHDAVAPIYFPQELARLQSIGKDLEHFYGQNWREKITVPDAALTYAQRLREVNTRAQALHVQCDLL